MDEPTASLSAHEVRRLFRIVRSLRARRRRDPVHLPPDGRGLRDRRPGHGPARRPLDLDAADAARLTPTSAIRDMVGTTLEQLFSRTPTEPGAVRPRGPRPRTRRAFSGRLVRRPRRRGPRVCRPRRRAAHRRRPGAVRDRARGRGRDPARRPAGDDPRVPSDALRLRHRLHAPRTADGLGLIFPLSIAANISLPSLAALPDTASGSSSAAARRRAAAAFRERLQHPRASVEAPVVDALGRQPAEGRAEQVARHTTRGC